MLDPFFFNLETNLILHCIQKSVHNSTTQSRVSEAGKLKILSAN